MPNSAGASSFPNLIRPARRVLNRETGVNREDVERIVRLLETFVNSAHEIEDDLRPTLEDVSVILENLETKYRRAA